MARFVGILMDMSSHERSCAHLKRAEYYQAEGLAQHALAELDLAVSAGPDVAEARMCRAECLRRQGRLAEAEADLSVAVRAAPDNPEPCVIMAQTLAAGRDFDSAIKYIDRAELIDGNWHRVHLIRGDVLLAAGREDDALESYRRAVRLAPENIEALTALASLRMDRGEYAKAVALADRLLAISPNCVDARVIKAMAMAEKGRADRALSELNRALRINPDHFRARLERAGMHLRTGRMDEAFIDYAWCVGADNTNIRALHGLGESAWRCGRVREAIDAYSIIIELGHGGADVYLGRAEALALAGRREEAVEDCTRALDYEPANPDIHASRGVFNMELGRYDDAMRDLSQAIALDGDLVEAIIARGDLRSRQGDLPGATADFAVAVRLSPDEPDLVGRWIRSIGDAGDPVTALRLLDRELGRHPDQPNLMLLKGDLLAEARCHDAARDCYAEIIAQSPNEMEPHLRLAEFYENRTEYDAALAEYDIALRLEPGDPFPRLMRAALLERMGKQREAECERAAASGLRRLRGR